MVFLSAVAAAAVATARITTTTMAVEAAYPRCSLWVAAAGAAARLGPPAVEVMVAARLVDLLLHLRLVVAVAVDSECVTLTIHWLPC